MFSNRLGVQNAYSSKVKVGNWSEEQHAQELQIKDHVSRSEIGSLKVTGLQAHLNTSLSPAPLTYSADGKIRFGDSVMFYSAQTEGVLSVDTSDKIAAADDAFAVTTSTLTQAHVARNTFTIEPYEASDRIGDVLKYAQPFRIRINDRLSQHPCFMRSEPVSASSFSRISRHQQVSFCTFPLKPNGNLSASNGAAAAAATAAATSLSQVRNSPTPMMLKAGKLVPRSTVATSAYTNSTASSGAVASAVAYPPSPFDTVWKCVYKEIGKRFEFEGQAVQANAELLLEHAHTKHALSSDKLNYYNDFGVEFEVSGHTHLTTSKKQNLYAELRGTTTVHTPVRNEHTHNTWAILTSSQPEDNTSVGGGGFGDDVKSSTAKVASPKQSQAKSSTAAAVAPNQKQAAASPKQAVASPKVGQSSSAAPQQKQKESPKQAEVTKTADDEFAGNAGVEVLRRVLLPRGAAAVHALSRFCRVLDSSRTGSISAADLSTGLDQLGGGELTFSRDEWNELCQAIATGHDTQVSYGALLDAIRGSNALAGRRLKVVERAYQRMDKLKRGLIRLEDVSAAYDASADPLVKQKIKTPQQVVTLVTSAFDGYGGDNSLTFDEFADYYATVSVFVPSDDFFVRMIAAAYKVAE